MLANIVMYKLELHAIRNRMRCKPINKTIESNSLNIDEVSIEELGFTAT